jgi:hypothetical protein
MKVNILCSSYFVYYALQSQFPREILLPFMVENERLSSSRISIRNDGVFFVY